MDAKKLSELFKQSNYTKVSFERKTESIQSLISLINDALGNKANLYEYDLKIENNKVNVNLKEKP